MYARTARTDVSRRRLLLATSVLATAALATSVIANGPVRPAAATSISPDISAWAPYWTVNESLTAFNAHAGMFSEISPFGFSVTGPTTIASNIAWTPLQLQNYMTAAHAAGTRVVPTLADAMPPLGMATILADPVAQPQHIQTILDFITTNGFDGIDLDYESFAFSDGRASWEATSPSWITFLGILSQQLHALGKTLEVSVPPIYDSGTTSASGYWVYNYAGMAPVVDRIKVMAYEYSGASPGPGSPYSWDQTIIMATLGAGVPAAKFVLGLPAYGKDWVTSVDGSCPAGVTPRLKSMTSKSAPGVAYAHGQVPVWDATRHERTFHYHETFSGNDAGGNFVSCNVFRTAWYVDAQGMSDRVLLARTSGLVGVSLWALSGEESSAWTGISAATQGSAWAAPSYPVPAPAPAPPPATFSPGVLTSSVIHVPFTMERNTTADTENFAVGGDQQIYHRYTIKGSYTAWSTLGSLPGGVAVNSSQVSWGTNFLGNPELYVTGVDGNVYHDFATPGVGTGWSGWSTLTQPAGGSASDVQVGRNYLGNQEMYIVAKNGNVYHRFATPGLGTGWSEWDTLGGPAGTSVAFGVHVGRNDSNNQELYVVGANGVMYHDFATPGRGSGWNGWDPMAPVAGVTPKGDMNVGLNFLGNQELYFVGSDNQVYHNFATPGQGTGWSTFSSLGTPSGLTLDGDLYLEATDYRVLSYQDLLVFGTNSTGKVAGSTIQSTPGIGSGWSNWVQEKRAFVATPNPVTTDERLNAPPTP